ncbi:MAG: hypothetical protein ACLUS6_14560 [Dysosmobacter sp.]
MEFRFELPDGYSYQDVLALMRVLIRKRKIGRWVRLLSRIFPDFRRMYPALDLLLPNGTVCGRGRYCCLRP